MDDDLRDLLGQGVKRGGIGISYPRKSEEQGRMMSVDVCEALVK